MDPIETLKVAKDTSLALIDAAQRRGWDVSYFQQGDMYLEGDRPPKTLCINCVFWSVENPPTVIVAVGLNIISFPVLTPRASFSDNNKLPL